MKKRYTIDITIQEFTKEDPPPYAEREHMSPMDFEKAIAYMREDMQEIFHLDLADEDKNRLVARVISILTTDVLEVK